MTTQPASVSLLMDNSGSMSSKSTDSVNTNLQLLQTDTNTFMSIMQGTGSADNQLGQVGLVNFNTSASVLYALTSLDSGGNTLGAAIGKVNGLSATGRTNITDAISKGHTMLAGVSTSTYNRAMVLFSDGMWNEGGNPTNPPTDIPIYAIGYGSASQLSYLQTIATKTGGQYHVTGDPGILATYYNDIIQDTGVAHAVANAAYDIPQYLLFTTPATVPAGEPWHVFTATWADNSLNYTGSTPGPGQIQVLLNNPSGGVVTPDVVDAPAGGGYAVLTVNNPVAGTWKITTHPAGLPAATPTIGAAHGVFTAPGSINAAVTPHSVNSPLRVTARVTDDGEPLEHVDVHAYSIHPRHSHEELLDRHEADVRRILECRDFPEDVHPEEAALRVLNRERPELRLFQHERQPGGKLDLDGDGHLVEIQSYKRGVPNTVYVVMSGTARSSGQTFQRTRLVTVVP